MLLVCTACLKFSRRQPHDRTKTAISSGSATRRRRRRLLSNTVGAIRQVLVEGNSATAEVIRKEMVTALASMLGHQYSGSAVQRGRTSTKGR